MDIGVEINDKVNSGLAKDFIDRIVSTTVKMSGYNFRSKKVSLSFAVISENEMKKLNRLCRKKDSVTDVLSFSEYKNKKALETAGDKNIFLGEIILCYNDIKRYSKKNGLKTKVETTRVISHGVLHLLGFRHGEKMFFIQDCVAKL